MYLDIIKLIVIFAIIIAALKFKLKLYQVFIIAIAGVALLWKIHITECLELLWTATKDWNNISVLLVLFSITFLQRILEKRSQLKLAQKDLNGIFNNRRINATLAPIFVGLLPSAAAAIICGDIVSDACKDDLSIDEKAFVTSYFRHIPESFLPTYPVIIMMCELSGVSLTSFVLGMLPIEAVLFALGYLFQVRKIPKETGDLPSKNKWMDLLHLVEHLWTLIAIIALIMFFHLSTVAAIGIITLLALFVYRFKVKDLLPLLKSAFEPAIISGYYVILVFAVFIKNTGVLKTLPEVFSSLPIPIFLIFALIFFFGSVVSGSTAIIAMCTTMAFASVPNAGMPLMILLMSFSYAAMQISPTHVCLSVVTEYYHSTFGGLVKKTIPVISVFCVIAVGYYLLLTLIV